MVYFLKIIWQLIKE